MRLNLIFFVIIFLCMNVSAVITGESVTGKATNQNLGMNITVVINLPVLNIILPENETYIYNNTIPLNYSTSNALNVWYNLDNSTNITISSNILFSSGEGIHTLYLYANNSKGITSKSNSFYVNTSIFTIVNNEYFGIDRGDSTNFSVFSYEDLQDLQGIILEKNNFGKIIFNEAINMTDDKNFSDRILDLDSYTNISHNRIEINSIALPNFNKPATLYFYNLSFSSPRVLRDGLACSPLICTGLNYSYGTLMFNVTGFSVYSVEETPVEEPPPTIGGGSSSSGGGGTIVLKDFVVDKETMFVSLRQGETKQREILINNTGNQKLVVSVYGSKNIKDFIKISEPVFSLNPKESKIIFVEINSGEDIYPDLYLGDIIVNAEDIEKKVLTSIEIESKKVLLGVSVKILDKYKKVLPGNKIVGNVEIFDPEGTEKNNVKIEYFIKNEKGDIVIYDDEIISVDNNLTLKKTFKLPRDIPPGNYVFYVRLIYGEDVTISAEWFSVILEAKPFGIQKDKFIIFIILFIIVLLFFIIFIEFKHRKVEKKIKKNMLKKKIRLKKNKL